MKFREFLKDMWENLKPHHLLMVLFLFGCISVLFGELIGIFIMCLSVVGILGMIIMEKCF